MESLTLLVMDRLYGDSDVEEERKSILVDHTDNEKGNGAKMRVLQAAILGP